MTEKAEAVGTISANVRLYVISSLAGVAFSIAALINTGAGGAGGALTLLVTVWAEREAAWPPSAVCSGLAEGFVYATVIVLPYATELARVKTTFVPETETELILLTAEFTWTEKAEAAGTILASVRLYVISSLAGVAFSIAALIYTGVGGAAGGALTLLVTVWAESEAACPPAAVCRGLEEGFV